MKSYKDSLLQYNAGRLPADRSSFCHAPSVNLNFSQSGDVTACCYNRNFILGKYPKNTIEEIWNGKRILELRKLLRQNDLSYGCHLCKHQLKANNFSGLLARQYDAGFKGDPLKKTSILMPKIMEFEMSNGCNLECIMCNGFFSSSIRKNREKLEPMKSPYDEAFVEQLRPFLPHILKMKFLGGEPFLNPLYYKIWELILEVNPKINAIITTNASVLNPKIKELITRLNPAITVSLDSLDKKTYESIRKNAKFETVMSNLEFFIRRHNELQGSSKVMSIVVCPMPQNWKTIPDLFDFCNKRGLYFGVNTVVWPPECSLKTLSKKEQIKVHQFLQSRVSADLANSAKWWVRENFNVYMGMVNQIHFWATESA